MAHHFDATEWIDYARDVLEQTRRTAMDAHLASGCAGCQATIDWQRDVLAAAGREADYTPPESAIRLARAIFPSRAASPLVSLPRLLARLASDTARQPLAPGVRGRDRGGRHALFEAGGASVDLRLEHDAVRARVLLVGQVLDRQQGTPRPPAQAVIVRGRRVVASAALNEFGEFRLDCPADGRLTLQVPVAGGTRRVDVPLDPLMPGPSGDVTNDDD
jgi:hypothetical protein